MTVPTHREKYDAPGLFDPEEAVRAQGDGDGLPDVPPAVVLGYQPALTATLRTWRASV